MRAEPCPEMERVGACVNCAEVHGLTAKQANCPRSEPPPYRRLPAGILGHLPTSTRPSCNPTDIR